jgi:hypothetical protein
MAASGRAAAAGASLHALLGVEEGVEASERDDVDVGSKYAKLPKARPPLQSPPPPAAPTRSVSRMP